MNRRAAGFVRRCAQLIVVALVLGACGGDTTESGLQADKAPIDADLVSALADGVDPDRVPEVQRNFLENCVKGGDESFPAGLPSVQRNGLVAVCGCVYDAFVASVLAEADGTTPADREADAFARFTNIEDDLRADGVVAESLLDLVRDCIRSEAGI